MSTACQLQSPAAEDSAAIGDFLASAYSIAQSIDQTLARLLSEILGGSAGKAEPASWSGERREGLALCLSMLSYVRPEAERTLDIDNVDKGINYIARELARIEQDPMSATRSIN